MAGDDVVHVDEPDGLYLRLQNFPYLQVIAVGAVRPTPAEIASQLEDHVVDQVFVLKPFSGGDGSHPRVLAGEFVSVILRPARMPPLHLYEGATR